MSNLAGKVRGLLSAKEPLVFVAALVILLGVWGFAELLGDVRAGDTMGFDARILKSLRQADDPRKLVGPAAMETIVRDVTALGGTVVLIMVVTFVVTFLMMIRRRHMVVLILASTMGATAINATIKSVVERPRPTVVPKLTDVTSESFPSGHSAMSAAVYLTLGGLLATTVSKRRLKVYFLSVALLLTFLVGASRVALGVHYPTDVLAGWTTGLVWALLCWLVARYLQRRGAIEKEEDPTVEQR